MILLGLIIKCLSEWSTETCYLPCSDAGEWTSWGHSSSGSRTSPPHNHQQWNLDVCWCQGLLLFFFPRGWANSWSNQFGEQHKVWKQQIVVEEKKIVKERDHGLLLGYSKSQCNRRIGRRGKDEITVGYLRSGSISFYLFVQTPKCVCTPSGNAVLLHLLIQKHFQKIICTNLLFFTSQSLPLAQVFVFIFHRIFYSLFALWREFLLLNLVQSEGVILVLMNGNSIETTKGTWHTWMTTANSMCLNTLLPIFLGRRHYIIWTPGRFFSIITKVTDRDWNLPLCEHEDALAYLFLIREHRNEGTILQTASCRCADLSSVLQVREMQLDHSVQIFPVIPFDPYGKGALLNSSSKSGHRNKWLCEWM